MDALTILLVLLTTVLMYVLVKYRDKSKLPPPGPKGYPLVGNSLDVDLKNLHLSLTDLADKYGDIFKISIFGMEAVVLNSADLVREALLREPNASIFAARIDSYFGNEFMFGRSDIVFSDNTAVWAKRRKFSHRLLKAYGEGLKVIEKRIHEEIRSTITQVKSYSEKAFDPEQIISDFLIGIMTNLLTGKNFRADSDISTKILEYDDVVNKFMHPSITLVLTYFPFMKYVPGKYRNIHQRCSTLQQEFFDLVKSKKNDCDSGMIHDLYQEMSRQNQLKESDQWLPEDVILVVLANIVTGGLKPDVQKKLQDEVEAVVGSDRLPSLTDKGNMPYTEAVVLETIRFISHLPLLVPHVNSRDAKLRGFDIKKGSMILINVWKIHSNENVFVKANDFIPERFIGEDGNLLPSDSPLRQSFLSFGIGKRACIGEIFVRNRIFLLLASLMQNFTFVSENGETQPLMKPAGMVQKAIRMPQRYKCKAITRNNR